MKLGISAGYGNCRACFIDKDGRPCFIKFENGFGNALPSVIYISPNGKDILVGRKAIEEYLCNQNNERLLRLVYSGFGQHQTFYLDNGEEIPYEKILSILLSEVIREAEKIASLHGEKIDLVVLACPNYLGNIGRAAVEKVMDQVVLSDGSNLRNFFFEDECIASLIAHGADICQIEKNYLVYSLGAGEFASYIAHYTKDDENYFRLDVHANTWWHEFGSVEWEHVLKRIVVEKIAEITGNDEDSVWENTEMRNWYCENLERIKISLSTKEELNVILSYDGRVLKFKISRKEMEERTEAGVNHTFSLIDEMLEKIGFNISDIDEILLVGGGTIPSQIREMLERKYSKPIIFEKPERLISIGAAITANDTAEPEEIMY